MLAAHARNQVSWLISVDSIVNRNMKGGVFEIEDLSLIGPDIDTRVPGTQYLSRNSLGRPLVPLDD